MPNLCTKRLFITSGEPAGIGPDLCLKLAETAHDSQLIIAIDPDLLSQRAAQLGITNLDIKLIDQDYLTNNAPQPSNIGELFVYPIKLAVPVTCGETNTDNAQYVIEMLTLAADGALNQQWDAIVTAPVHKGVINEAGMAFSGHTEFFRDRCQVPEVVMMLATLDLRVALVTTHLPLKEVAEAITVERVQRVCRILDQDLKTYFDCSAPKILVAGLNPHAGEDGHLGREEIDIIEPAMAELRQQGMDLIGPLPADTLFTPKYLETADAALAMFHDQGLPVLKFHGFGRAANITLGMPIIRTSVDHGTALDLAGSGAIDAGSLYTAVQVAEQMAQRRQ